ncbi:hypothetical protein [Leifsonia shinshuensis]|uniref:Uncharacterized protein n=1 Tax=Leifsonia shinshuensis TaxID=150026 RepID=A0A853CWB1_9MICO|nr:hypothetical protein [Leifsonia shinshuensis]NYJ23474.1 hypothetical protein [Leifsonia shinshuensis]
MSTTQQIALGVGAAGALVDVSAYCTGPEGVAYSYGRQSEFRDPNPGQVTFILDNYDGRFTPGNLSTPYASPLTEGTAVCWSIGGRLVSGMVSAIGFASSETEWGRVTITCGDIFYFANRTLVGDIAATMASTNAWLYWSLNDAASSGQAAETSGNGGPSLTTQPPGNPGVFGLPGVPATTDTQMALPATAAAAAAMQATGPFPVINYPAGSLGFWGLWYTPNAASFVEIDSGPSGSYAGFWRFQGSSVSFGAPGWTSGGTTVAFDGLTHYFALGTTYAGTTFTATLYIDGVAAGTSTGTVAGTLTNALAQPKYVRLFAGDGTGSYSPSFSHFSHSPVLIHEEYAASPTTTANRVRALAQTVPGMTIGTLDPNISTAPIGPPTASNVTAWSLMCDAVRTEQGHLYAATTGTLLAPTTTVNMRARTRPTAVTLTLDAAADIEGLPQIDRDVTNLYATITASGPSNSAAATDRAAVARVGAAATSETVTLANPTDLLGYAQDRLQRGENVALKVSKVDINTTTSAVTLAQLLGLNLGDRVRLTNLPTAALGFTQWDGWFLGATEVHNTLSGDVFTLYLAPVLPSTAVFDTDVFSAGTDLTLSSALTAGATSMVVATASPLTFLETVQVPYTLQVDSEQVTVTACTALSGSTQTATITRGANGTTPAAHATGALVDVAQPGIYAF